MRYARQNMILDLIKNHNIDTQESLVSHLRDAGFNVTQATISRDIKELHLIKIPSGDGSYKYSASESDSTYVSERYLNILKETLKDVNSSGNIIVVKTLSGCAAAAGEAIDNLHFTHVIGSIAGDNTLMMVVDDEEHVQTLLDRFNKII